MIELDHTFSTGQAVTHNWEAILDLDRVITCVEGGQVLERTSPDSARAEIHVKMGAMGLRFTGTVTVVERDEDTHRAVLQVRSEDAGGQGSANADVTFELSGGGGTIHTAAEITGKAVSMGEGVAQTVLDALIKDFTDKLATI